MLPAWILKDAPVRTQYDRIEQYLRHLVGLGFLESQEVQGEVPSSPRVPHCRPTIEWEEFSRISSAQLLSATPVRVPIAPMRSLSLGPVRSLEVIVHDCPQGQPIVSLRMW